MARAAKRGGTAAQRLSKSVFGQSFLDEHRATLSRASSGWALRYRVASYEYGSRLAESIDCEIPIAAKNYDVALLIAEVVLREHVAPAAPEPEAHAWTPPALPTGRHMLVVERRRKC
jgi:hypothetical protein